MVAHRRAAYREASDFFESNLPRFKSLIAKEPKNTRWSFELANLLSLQADVLSILGAAERNRARENLTEADRILRALIEQDPANREWLFTSIKVDLKNTQLNLAEGRFEAVQQTLDRVRPQLESLVKAEPTDRNFRGWLITVLRANAQLGFSRGSKPEESLRRALTEARALIKEDRADDRIVGECMQAYIISGLMADMTGNTSAAMEFYVSAFELARDRMDTCADYHILDPALRSLALLGQKEKHARLLARLSAYSYVPIFPWPEIKPSPFR